MCLDTPFCVCVFICELSLVGDTHGAQDQAKDLELAVNHLTVHVCAREREIYQCISRYEIACRITEYNDQAILC